MAYQPTKRLRALGGVGAIALNLSLYGIGPRRAPRIAVDLGVAFAGDDLPGIDLIMPISVPIAEAANILALVLTMRMRLIRRDNRYVAALRVRSMRRRSPPRLEAKRQSETARRAFRCRSSARQRLTIGLRGRVVSIRSRSGIERPDHPHRNSARLPHRRMELDQHPGDRAATDETSCAADSAFY